MGAALGQEVLGRIRFSGDLEAVADADVVIESAIEADTAAVDLLKKLDAVMLPEAVLGTHASMLKLEPCASALTRPERFVGLHFLSPVIGMQLVEVGCTTQTADHALQRFELFCSQIGKTVVRVKASPGYLVNRLLVAYLLHGIETLESGIASADDIDQAMQLGCGHPVGPLTLCDLLGIDVVCCMADALQRELKDDRYRIPSTLKQLLQQKHFGRMTGIGIYDYTGMKRKLNPSIKTAR